MTWQERAEKAEKLLQSVVADVEGMASGETIEFDGETEELLGPFGAGRMDFEGPWGSDQYLISWPCITILRDRIKEHLKEVENG